MDMLVCLLLFLGLIVASALGLPADSRDGADWAPTDEGRREPPAWTTNL